MGTSIRSSGRGGGGGGLVSALALCLVYLMVAREAEAHLIRFLMPRPPQPLMMPMAMAAAKKQAPMGHRECMVKEFMVNFYISKLLEQAEKTLRSAGGLIHKAMARASSANARSMSEKHAKFKACLEEARRAIGDMLAATCPGSQPPRQHSFLDMDMDMMMEAAGHKSMEQAKAKAGHAYDAAGRAVEAFLEWLRHLEQAQHHCRDLLPLGNHMLKVDLLIHMSPMKPDNVCPFSLVTTADVLLMADLEVACRAQQGGRAQQWG